MVEFKAGSCSSGVGRAVMVVHVDVRLSRVSITIYFVALLLNCTMLLGTLIIPSTYTQTRPCDSDNKGRGSAKQGSGGIHVTLS